MVTLLLILMGTASGVWLGFAFASWKKGKEIQRLQGLIQERERSLKEAQTDQELIRALQEGEIGLKELREVGLASKETTSNDKQEAPPEPVFTPLPYKRNIRTIRDMIPGDEVWISLSDVHHTPNGVPILHSNTSCCPVSSEGNRCRVRKLKSGELQLGFDPKDTALASGKIVKDGIKVRKFVKLPLIRDPLDVSEQERQLIAKQFSTPQRQMLLSHDWWYRDRS